MLFLTQNSCLPNSPNACPSSFPPNRQPISSQAIDQVVFKIRQWLGSCSNHPQCGKIEERVLPDRYLDIGHASTDQVRLCLNDGNYQGCYVALSYCWGLYNTFLLTRSNIETFMAEIPIEQLPQTYLDLIDIARGIGFQYLWIDALCILQDSRHDWDRQAAQMSEIYGNAALNISASRATGVTEGFLHPREPLDASGTHRMLQEPTFERGWCVQERVLSRRLLEFRRTQMMWACLESFDAEKESYIPSTGPLLFGIQSEVTTEFWYTLIDHHYTSCQLTRQSDRLPALSGIASVFAKTCNASYLAGHWNIDMPQSLLWYNDNRVRRRCETWRAPTWSWASISGHVSFPIKKHSNDTNVLALVLDHGVNTSSGNLYGEVLDGWLRISAPALPAMLPNSIEPDAAAQILIHGRTLKGLVRLDDDSMIHTSSVELVAIQRGWSKAMYEVDAAKPHGLYLRRDSGGDLHILGLIVAPIEAGSNHFKRLGFFELVDEDAIFRTTPLKDIILL